MCCGCWVLFLLGYGVDGFALAVDHVETKLTLRETQDREAGIATHELSAIDFSYLAAR